MHVLLSPNILSNSPLSNEGLLVSLVRMVKLLFLVVWEVMVLSLVIRLPPLPPGKEDTESLQDELDDKWWTSFWWWCTDEEALVPLQFRGVAGSNPTPEIMSKPLCVELDICSWRIWDPEAEAKDELVKRVVARLVVSSNEDLEVVVRQLFTAAEHTADAVAASSIEDELEESISLLFGPKGIATEHRPSPLAGECIEFETRAEKSMFLFNAGCPIKVWIL